MTRALTLIAKEAEHRLNQAEVDAAQHEAVIAGGGTALPEPADASIDCGPWTVHVHFEPAGWSYYAYHVAHRGFAFRITRQEALATIEVHIVREARHA